MTLDGTNVAITNLTWPGCPMGKQPDWRPEAGPGGRPMVPELAIAAKYAGRVDNSAPGAQKQCSVGHKTTDGATFADPLSRGKPGPEATPADSYGNPAAW